MTQVVPRQALTAMFHARIPAAVGQQVLVPMGVVSAAALAGGMSGAIVFRLSLASGESRLLKRWPLETSPQRVAEVDRVLMHSRRRGFLCTPELKTWDESAETCFVHRGGCWQVMDWIDGTPLKPTADLIQIKRGAEAIAAFHQSVVDLGTTRQTAPAIGDRLRRTEQLRTSIQSLSGISSPDAPSLAPSLDPMLAAALGRARETVVWNWDEVSARITRSLCMDEYGVLDCQYVLRDIHCENALFSGENPAGLIDFDALRVDTPWTDLARWTGSFLGFRHSEKEVWDAALAGFCLERAFQKSSEIEIGRRLAKDLCYATTWISLANWLVWLLLERREFEASQEEISLRIDNLRDLAVLGV